MKKIFLIAFAMASVVFGACTNKGGQQADNQNAQEEVAAADDPTAEIAAQLEAGNIEKLQEALQAAKEKLARLVAENPELAKEYLGNVQSYLKENAERVKEVVGDNQAVQAVVNGLTELSPESVISSLQSQASAAEEAGQQQADALKAAGEQAIDDVKKAGQEKIDEGKQKAADAVKDGAQKVNDKVNEATDAALKKMGL